MEDKGFYSPAKSDEILAELKVGEIKEIIAKLGLSIKGKKDELISQLVNQVNESTLSSTLNSKKYSISDYGWQWMSEHKEEYEYYTCNDEFKSFDEYQTYWKTHNKHDDAVSKCLIEIKADKEMFGRYEYDSLIALYKEEQNKEKEILECLLKELLIDLSGAMDFANWKDAHFDRETIEACSRIVFTPHLVKTLPKYKDFYSEKMLTDIYELKLPVNACSLNDFKNIVELMLDNALDQETREDYQKRLTKKLKEIGFARAK